jgi:hypothetical protein
MFSVQSTDQLAVDVVLGGALVADRGQPVPAVGERAHLESAKHTGLARILRHARATDRDPQSKRWAKSRNHLEGGRVELGAGAVGEHGEVLAAVVVGSEGV